MEEISSTSPDKKHDLRLMYKSEIRFGPAYYDAFLDGMLLKDKLFGSNHLWSDNSRYLVMLEMRSIDQIVGADTYVSIYDLENGLTNSHIHESNGWITLKSFNGSVVFFERKVNKRFRRRRTETIDITQIENRESISMD